MCFRVNNNETLFKRMYSVSKEPWTGNKASSQPKVFLKEWRAVRNMTQTEVAARMGVSKSEVSRLEGSHRKVSISWLDRFSEALGVAREQLFTPPGVTILTRESVVPVGNSTSPDRVERAAYHAAQGIGEYGLSAAAPYMFVAMPDGSYLLIDGSKGAVVAKMTKV